MYLTSKTIHKIMFLIRQGSLLNRKMQAWFFNQPEKNEKYNKEGANYREQIIIDKIRNNVHGLTKNDINLLIINLQNENDLSYNRALNILQTKLIK